MTTTDNSAVIARLERQNRELAEALREIQQRDGISGSLGAQIIAGQALAKLDSDPAEQPEVPEGIFRDAMRYRFLRCEDNWGDDTDEGWDRLGHATFGEFDRIIDDRVKTLKDSGGEPFLWKGLEPEPNVADTVNALIAAGLKRPEPLRGGHDQ